MTGTSNAIIALVCIGALGLSGCLQGVNSPDQPGAKIQDGLPGPGKGFASTPVLAADALGDARDRGVDYFNTGSGCRFGCGKASYISEDIPQGAPGALPVDWMDLVDAGFLSETASHVQLGMRVARLTSEFPELTPVPGVARGVAYITCFGAALGERCVTVDVVPQKSGPLVTAYLSIFSEFCGEGMFNDFKSERPTIAPFELGSECALEVPVSITYGSPASIVFDVPKTFVELDGPSTPWTHIRANVTHFMIHPAPNTHSSVSVNTDALPHHHDHVGMAYPSGVADDLGPAAVEISFAPSSAALGAVAGPVANAPPGVFYGDHLPTHPVFDLLGTSIREEGTDIVITQTVAGLDRATVPDFEHSSYARISNGSFVEFGAFHMGDDWYGYAAKCFHFHCADSYHVKLPLTVIEGSPAQLELSIPREYFGNPDTGSIMTFLFTLTQEIHPATYYQENGKENVHTMSFIDQHVGTIPYVFVGEAVDREIGTHTHE